MEITFHRKPIEYFVIDNFLTEEHVETFLNECEMQMINANDQDRSAADDDGNILRKGSAKFLDRLYPFNRQDSCILSNLRGYLFTQNILKYIEETDTIFQMWQLINCDYTMISYYQDSDYYKPHKDNAVFTSLLWLNREPKGFNGGDLTFTAHNHTIDYKHNRCVIFPSVVTHEVSEIKMKPNNTNGRFCITNFSMVDFLK